MVKIKVSYCGIVDDCNKCISVCPVGALMKVPYGSKRSDVEKPDYIIRPYYEKLCIRCMKCVNCCPKDAITII